MLLEVDGLTKRFGGLVAVQDVTFSVAKGEILGVIGPNGSGKTTLLNMIGGQIVPTSGTIGWMGREIHGTPPYGVASRGLVKTFQNPQLFAELTSLENVMIAGHLHLKRSLKGGRWWEVFRLGETAAKRDIRDRARKVLERCRLSAVADEKVANLSYGQEKMLGVAMAIMCDPIGLLLDEPASGLGEEEIQNLEVVMNDLRRDGTTLCVIDHRIPFLRRVVDRIVALSSGRQIATGAPDVVLNHADVIEAYLGRSKAA